MKSIEIKELSTADILERIEEDRMQLTRMKLNNAVSDIENPQKIKETRRRIARMLTELRARELNEAAQ
jgi:large subunit ribosomal protein L29